VLSDGNPEMLERAAEELGLGGEDSKRGMDHTSCLGTIRRPDLCAFPTQWLCEESWLAE
jgi:hypothetical protein